MIIIGAKGFAKELLEELVLLGRTDNLAFFDNINHDTPKFLYDEFPILTSEKEVKNHFKNIDNKFLLGVGGPKNRKNLTSLFLKWGGLCETTLSKKCSIGSFNNTIGAGCTVMNGTIITNDIQIGVGCLINLNCTIGHDTKIGEYVEICPNTSISGNVKIGNNCFIGTGAIILPNITIGENSIIAAGTVVSQNVPENTMVAGVPGKIKKWLNNK